MKKIIVLAIVLGFGLSAGYSEEQQNEMPFKKILNEGELLKVPIDNSQIKRIAISMKNVLDKESVLCWSGYLGGKEKPENEIGPKKYRTSTLSPKIKDEKATRKLDRKKIVLDTGAMDAISLTVEKGKIEVEISEEKKTM